MSIMVQGHGSGSPGDLLNSRESFVRVLRSGADGVEVDVRRTADDVLVAIHDPAFADGRVVNQTLSNTIPSEVPTLVEVLDLCFGSLVNIEIKNYPSDPGFDEDEHVTDLVADLVMNRRRDMVLVSSFGMGCVDRFAERLPDVPTAFLLFYPGDPDELLDDVVSHGHQLVHPYDPLVDARFMEAAKARNLGVTVWMGKEDVGRIAELMSLGVDGLIASDPRSIREIERQADATGGGPR